MVHLQGELCFCLMNLFSLKFMSQNKKAAVIFVQNLRLPSCFKNAHILKNAASAFHGVHFISLVHLKVGSPSLPRLAGGQHSLKDSSFPQALMHPTRSSKAPHICSAWRSRARMCLKYDLSLNA